MRKYPVRFGRGPMEKDYSTQYLASGLPYFLGLKDEYSENDLEEALIVNLENFLMELGGDFTFVGRQRRLRIGNQWFRIDLLFYHRRLRCLVVIDLLCGRPHNRSCVVFIVMWRSGNNRYFYPAFASPQRHITDRLQRLQKIH